jgi:MoxR-like ATPase
MKLAQEYQSSRNGVDSWNSFQERFEGLLEQIAGVLVTSRRNIRLALVGLFAQGHVLLEDLPGVGKTLLAKTIASSIDGEFSRIQFTSVLLPSDITGTSVFDMRNQCFEFIPGPIFANVVVADDLNRAGPRSAPHSIGPLGGHGRGAGQRGTAPGGPCPGLL